MQNTHEIKRHIDAVRQTRKITGAMELISSARLKKILKHMEYNGVYLSRVQSAMKDILTSPHPVEHPYLKTGTGKKRLYIVIAGDKGMVGSYNSAILHFAYDEIQKCRESCMLFTIGIVAGDFFRSKGLPPDFEMPGLSQNPSLYNARQLMETVVDLYDRHEARSVYVIYTNFSKGSSAKPSLRRVLPIRISDYTDIQLNEPEHEIVYSPSANEVFERLVPQYLVGILFSALIQSYASEHFARRNAMHQATENADELIKQLQLQYNTARQTAITQEIAEISGAAEILKNRE